MVVDSYKLSHWMNARKLTVDGVAELSGIERERLLRVVRGADAELSERDGARLVAALDVATAQISDGPNESAPAIVARAGEIESTRRAIRRGGIHFYNYY